MSIDVPAGATHSAVLALIPAAEPVVAEHRARLDPACVAGVPAHVTVLYPFAPPDRLDTTVAALRDAVAGARAFWCRFTGIGWFGDDYVWLDPTPAAPFGDLTDRVRNAFPQYPPYGGEHEPHPHLTVGSRRHAPPGALHDAAERIRPRLPVDAYVDRLHLLAGARSPSSWRVLAELPLRG